MKLEFKNVSKDLQEEYNNNEYPYSFQYNFKIKDILSGEFNKKRKY